MSNTIWEGDHSVTNLKPKTFTWPDGQISDSDVQGQAGWSADKRVTRIHRTYRQASGTDVVTAKQIVHVARFAGTLTAVEIVPVAVPVTSGSTNKYVIVAVEYDTGGGWLNALNGAVAITSNLTNLTALTPDIYYSSYSANDLFRVSITASGSVGTQAQGLCINLIFDENTA